MKTDGSRSPFNLVLTISLVVLAVLCVQYYFKTKELRGFQATVSAQQSRRANLNMLLGELVEYSKTHTTIDPILESEGINVKAARGPATNTAKPATK